MKSFFRFALIALVLLLVAMFSALMAMRFAIHGGEVSVPKLVGYDSGRSRARGRGFGLERRDRAAVLQRRHRGRKDHVAGSGLGHSSPAWLAGAGCAEPRATAGRDSGCARTERTRCRPEYSPARTRCRAGFLSADGGSASGPGVGTESATERKRGFCTSHKLAHNDDALRRRPS